MKQKYRYLMFWIILFGLVVLMWQAIQANEVNQTGVPLENTESERDNTLLAIFLTWGPVLLIVGVWIFLMRQFHIRGNKVLSLGRGRREGQATVLLRQAKTKFGALDDLTRRRIESADEDTLLRIADRILTAQSPADLF